MMRALPAESRIAIEGLLSEFAWNADRGLGDALGGLFLEHGRLTVNDVVLSGAEEIARDCETRFTRPGRKTRHVWSNWRLERIDEVGVHGTLVQLTIESCAMTGGTQCRVNDIDDIYRQDDARQWRFVSRRIVREISFDTSRADQGE
ncbi:nuclear transport factor 2 family protein [Achromobacter pestifer]